MPRNLKNSEAFLLGEIYNDVKTIKKNQESVIEDVEDLKNRHMWLKGFIAAAGVIGGFLGSLFTSLKSYLIQE